MKKASRIYDFLKLSIENERLSHSYFVLGRAQDVSEKEIDETSALLMGIKEEIDIKKGLAVERLFVQENDKQVIERKEVSRVLEFTRLKPVFGSKRVVVIKNAHLFTKAAANHLLKILEEPPSYIIFLLLSHKPNLLPSTILSRCTIIVNRQETSDIKDDTEEKKLYRKIETMNLNELFLLAEELSKKEKKELVLFLDGWLKYYFDHKLKEGAATKVVNMIGLIKQARSLIESTAANPRLMIERLFIKMVRMES